jgi:hypothetical protein
MRRRVLRWSPRLLVVPLWLLGTSARADLIDPAEEACGKAGETCTVDGQSGVCVDETCSKLDYSNMGPDNVPGTRQYACVRCKIGAKQAEPAPTPAPTPPPEKQADAKQAGAPEPTATTKGTSCAVGPSASTLSFVLGLGLLGLAVRRRA